MTLVTRCPNCGTTFRVHAAQLAQKGGRVRCGKCAAVFDGVAGLNEPDAARETARSEPSPQLALFEPVEPLRIPDPRDMAGPMPDPEFLRDVPPPRGRTAWAIAAAAAFLALLFQLLFAYRTELSVLVPEAREPLEAGCRLLGCTLRLPRRPDLMSIETSDLESDRRRDGVIVLNAVLHNRAPFAQEYPALELTLTDERDQPVLRRVLPPVEYLGGDARAGQGIAPGAELTLRLHFQAGGIPAVGYRLYLFFS